MNGIGAGQQQYDHDRHAGRQTKLARKDTQRDKRQSVLGNQGQDGRIDGEDPSFKRFILRDSCESAATIACKRWTIDEIGGSPVVLGQGSSALRLHSKPRDAGLETRRSLNE